MFKFKSFPPSLSEIQCERNYLVQRVAFMASKSLLFLKLDKLWSNLWLSYTKMDGFLQIQHQTMTFSSPPHKNKTSPHKSKPGFFPSQKINPFVSIPPNKSPPCWTSLKEGFTFSQQKIQTFQTLDSCCVSLEITQSKVLRWSSPEIVVASWPLSRDLLGGEDEFFGRINQSYG